ncbi:MAG: apolipoprotein N-acyltransferase [Chlorobia bacterium]|nr:apolipoprotein N-acyltransferase [Fimbriimonadaceae bacterium]
MRESTSKEGFRSGFTFGFLLLLGQFAWLFSFINRWVQNPILAFIPYILGCALVALFFGILGWQVTLCWRHKMPWAIPLVWAGIEVFRSYVPGLAFPYGLIATPLWPFPVLIQNAYFGSIFLVGAWVVLVNVFLAQILAGDHSWRQIRGYVAGIALLLLGSWVRYSEPLPSQVMTVSIGQPGTDLAFGNRADNEALLRKVIPDFYTKAQLGGSELLVLPEGIAGSDGSFPPKPVFDVDPAVPVIFGGIRGLDPSYQTAFSFDGTWKYADKTRLVIFGEFVPFRNQLPFLASVFNLPGGDLVPADEVKALKVGKRTVGPLLCFEGLFPDIAYRQAMNGAELLAVMSVDDWYMGTTAPDQLKAGAIWRAVETGLPLVRSASMGYSFAVDQRGNLRGQLPTKESSSLRVELPVGPANPFRFFPIFPYAALATLVLLPLGILIALRRSTHS